MTKSVGGSAIACAGCRVPDGVCQSEPEADPFGE